MKRSGKFYRSNESEIMRSLGLQPTSNSGSGWVEKEDGQSESVICQLKSTDANSIRLNLDDWNTLEYNAAVSHKLPVFALQFIGTGDVFLAVRPDDLKAVAAALTGDAVYRSKVARALESVSKDVLLPIRKDVPETAQTTVKSAHKAREAYAREYERQFEKKARGAK